MSIVSAIEVQGKAGQWVNDWIRDGQSRRDKPHPHIMERIDVLIGEEYLGLDSDRKGDPLLPQVRSILIRERVIQEKRSSLILILSVDKRHTFLAVL